MIDRRLLGGVAALGIIASVAALGAWAARWAPGSAPGLAPVTASATPTVSPSGSPSRPSSSGPAPTPAPSPSPTAVTPSSPAPVPSTGQAPSSPVQEPPSEGVTTLPPATRVERVELPAIGYSSEVRIMEVGDRGAIDPPDFVHAWWIRDRGAVPSSTATDTAYLACHTHSRRPASAVPCNDIAPERIPVGSPLLVTTDAEQLTYRVTAVRLVAKDDFADDQEIWGVHPGRLVWVTCYLEDGRLSGYNAVVLAELVP